MLYSENNALQKTMIYAENYEKETVSGGSAKEYDYICSPEGLSAIAVKTNGARSLYYVHTDHLGSIRVVTNASKGIQSRCYYDAWGKRTLLAGTAITSRGYTGHEHLTDFGLINMNAQLYDPALGRFIAMDPFVQMPDFSQSFNRYSYCLNNPLKYTDPDGEIVWFVPILIGVGVYALIEYGTQVAANYMEAQANPTLGYTNADIWWNKIDWFDIAIAGVEGGLSVAFPAAAPYIKYASPLVKNAADLNFDGTSKVVGKDFGIGEYFVKTGLDITTTAMTDLIKWGTTKQNPFSFDKSKPFQTKSLFERYDNVSFKDFWQKTYKDMYWNYAASFFGNSAKQGWQNQYDDYLQRQNKPHYKPYGIEFPYPYYYHKNTKPNEDSDNNMQVASKLSKLLQLNLSK